MLGLFLGARSYWLWMPLLGFLALAAVLGVFYGKRWVLLEEGAMIEAAGMRYVEQFTQDHPITSAQPSLHDCLARPALFPKRLEVVCVPTWTEGTKSFYKIIIYWPYLIAIPRKYTAPDEMPLL